MNSIKFGSLVSLIFLISSVGAYAQTNELKGYTPPVMFGGSGPQKKTELPQPTPAPPPAHVPIDAPKPVAQPAPAPVTQQIPMQPVAPVATPAPKQVIAAISAEDLLNHAATGNSVPAITNPLAVPAAKVEQGLPLPGSVPPAAAPKPKKTSAYPPVPMTPKVPVPAVKETPKPVEKPSATKPAPVKKEEPKKVEPKKAAAKPPVIKPVVKKEPAKQIVTETPKIKAPEAVKPAPKPVEPKPVVKKAEPVKAPAPIEKKAEPKKIETPKPVVAPSSAPVPAPSLPPIPAPAKTPDLPLPNTVKAQANAYHPVGKKNMPTVKQSAVEKSTDMKSPLPVLEPVPPETPPTPNEKIIDKALQDRLVKPDLKSIIAPTTTPAVEPKKTENSSKIFKPELISLEFKPDMSDVQPDQKQIVDLEILPKMEKDPLARLQLLAYASASKEGQSSARRISLARGLSLRAYLLEKGIQPSRIDIRALGDNTNEKPVNRVDLLVLNAK